MSLKKIVKEINNLEYDNEKMLTTEYAYLLNEKVTSNHIIILNYINDNVKVLTGEISTLLNISASAVSQLLNRMEKMKLIKRLINPENRREVIVKLDSYGKEYLKTSLKIENSIIDRFYSKLSSDDLEDLKRIYEVLNRIIKKEIDSRSEKENDNEKE